MAKKIVYIWLAVIALVVVLGIIFSNNKKQEELIYTIPSPEEVVTQYFTAWSNNNYPDMYATISDGFKKIEPTAKNLASFREYASSQQISGVNIISIKERFNSNTTAQVEYAVEFILSSGTKRTFTDTFTLKYRQGDVIPGWKLIHPYGENIDVS